MVIEIKRSERFFIVFGIIALLSAIFSILIIVFVKESQAVPYILMTPLIVFLVVLVYFILFLINYIKKPYLSLIKFEDDYIKYFVITSYNKIGFNHKSKEVIKFLTDLLKSKDVNVIDSQ